MQDHYTVKKIMQIIKHYHININNLQDMVREQFKSVGVSQYGVESSLPKGNNISNVVEQEAIRRIENIKFWAEMMTDIVYIQDRRYRVTDEKQAMILNLYLSGYSTSQVAEVMQMDRTWVHRNLVKIAQAIKSYPQEEATKTTN